VLLQVAKNIVLAGVSVVILDDGLVHPNDLSYNFFVTGDDIGKQVRHISHVVMAQ